MIEGRVCVAEGQQLTLSFPKEDGLPCRTASSAGDIAGTPHSSEIGMKGGPQFPGVTREAVALAEFIEAKYCGRAWDVFGRLRQLIPKTDRRRRARQRRKAESKAKANDEADDTRN